MKLTSFIFLLFYTANWIAAQQKPAGRLLKIASDCKDAIPLTIESATTYGPTQAPKSFGEIQEFNTTDTNSEISFSKEHNSAWYLLTIDFDGELSFEIVATDTTNDYDFLLYRYMDSNFCNSLLQKTVKPVRGNISNNKWPGMKGLTGLSRTATQLFHKRGFGNPFSKSIAVRRGEQYMLVLDNFTAYGKGHTIYFHSSIEKPPVINTSVVREIPGSVNVDLQGVVLGADSQPIVADVKLADYRGITVKQTTTDANGTYRLKTQVEENKNYSLTFSNDSSFVVTRIINTADLNSATSAFDTNTQIILPKLKRGAKYILGNINFYPNIDKLLPQSFPSVQALYHLMEKNEKMKILIEGHVNAVEIGGYPAAEYFPGEFQKLSEARAAMVRKYLIDNGIAPERIQTIGMAAKQMLYPNAKSEDERSANRRVEVKIVSMDGE